MDGRRARAGGGDGGGQLGPLGEGGQAEQDGQRRQEEVVGQGPSVVIPSLTGEARATVASLARQTLEPSEVEIVVGVRPGGRARNLGVSRTSAPVVVFMDDDAVLGSDDVLARMLAPLADPGVGAVGIAKLVPPGSSPFQRRVARQVPRIEHPVVDRLTESNPPVGRFGYTDVTTTSCAMRREVLEECGGFDESLERGMDSELFYRLRQAGYRLVLAPGAWAWHPAPATLRRLLWKHLWYGVGYAQEVRLHPQLAAGRPLTTPAHAAAYLLVRTTLLPAHAVFPYSRSNPSSRPVWRPQLQPLGALASYAAALGYVYGWYRGRDGGRGPSRLGAHRWHGRDRRRTGGTPVTGVGRPPRPGSRSGR